MRTGVTPEVVVKTLRVALGGTDAGLLHENAARETVPIVLRLDRAQRSGLEGLLATTVPSPDGQARPAPRARDRPRTTRASPSSTTRTCSP